jgi:large subunit ribosomal protein L24
MKEQIQSFPGYKKNDVVQVISGKYKGKSGKILKLLKSKQKLIIEKVNLVKRHTKPTQTEPQGGIIEKEAPMHVCKVLPVSEKTGKPMRIAKWLKESASKKSEVPKVKKAKSKTRGEK